jgi:alkanesulfonate monooxygenase SsuD/methylene tetrahydromethanopterin reductase-like flavin-dependent oxidoreductase (luciferase family)
MEIGYTCMGEQRAPQGLLDDLRTAEELGFDFAVFSDHISPWLESQGHSPYAWSVLGAATQVTSTIPLMTFVTCPTIRYHPAVVAQKAATVQLLSQGRFILGLGSGEQLNEHVVGQGFPPADLRQEMLDEESAKLYDPPRPVPPLGIAISGRQSAGIAATRGDLAIATEPKPELVKAYRDAGGEGPVYGQLAVCLDADREVALARAHDQFRWFGLGWKVNAELPGTSAFESASQFVRPEDVAASVPCGPDTDAVSAAVQEFADAGFTHLALVQVGGGSQGELFERAPALLPQLRAL